MPNNQRTKVLSLLTLHENGSIHNADGVTIATLSEGVTFDSPGVCSAEELNVARAETYRKLPTPEEVSDALKETGLRLKTHNDLVVRELAAAGIVGKEMTETELIGIKQFAYTDAAYTTIVGHTPNHTFLRYREGIAVFPISAMLCYTKLDGAHFPGGRLFRYPNDLVVWASRERVSRTL